MFNLTQEEGEFMIGLSRRAVGEYLRSGKRISLPKEVTEKLLKPCGVFVTLSVFERGEKQLRGCIGYPYPTDPLAQAVIRSAISSATEDPRFNPLALNELDNVVFEISILTPPELVRANSPKEYPSKIKVGKDGLIIERGILKGLLLPQVPVEWNWDEEEFLSQCCIKAGLLADNWLLDSTKLYKFQAIVFEEESPRGPVKRKTLGGK